MKEKITMLKKISHFYISREKEIKEIGIIPHLTVVGERLLNLSLSEDISEKDKKHIYSNYLYLLDQDIELIEEHKKIYKEKLTGTVCNIVTPFENNILQVMKQCNYSIDNYIEFILEEEKENETLLEALDILKEASELVYETEDMITTIIQSVEEV